MDVFLLGRIDHRCDAARAHSPPKGIVECLAQDRPAVVQRVGRQTARQLPVHEPLYVRTRARDQLDPAGPWYKVEPYELAIRGVGLLRDVPLRCVLEPAVKVLRSGQQVTGSRADTVRERRLRRRQRGRTPFVCHTVERFSSNEIH